MKYYSTVLTYSGIIGLLLSFVVAPSRAQTKQFQPEDALKQMKEKKAGEASLQLVSYKKKYEITSKKDIEKTVNQLFSSEYFYWPVYNKEVTKLDALSKGQLENSFHPQGYDSYVDKIKENITPYLTKQLEVGDSVFEVKWQLKGETFTSLAIFSPHHFIYEHMLVNIMKVTKTVDRPKPAQPSRTRSLNFSKTDSSPQN